MATLKNARLELAKLMAGAGRARAAGVSYNPAIYRASYGTAHGGRIVQYFASYNDFAADITARGLHRRSVLLTLAKVEA